MTDISDVNAKVSALEERMNTLQARTNESFERLRSDFADRDAARSRRETWLVVFLVATVIGAGLVIAIPG